jgi:hypothetical protein
MLVCLGYDIDLHLSDGQIVRCPDSATLLYDKTGQHWPWQSILIAPFARSGRGHEPTSFSKKWFGRTYPLREGETHIPPRELSQGWRSLGHAERIFYTRGSGDQREAKYEGNYEHSFKERSLFDVFTFQKAHLPEVLQIGRKMRIEIGRWHVVTARGLVSA